jgi:predicted O-linked N-acetylglucosamine transferase (SPINDLY family)
MRRPTLADADRHHLAGRFPQAVQAYRQLALREPGNFEVWNGLGHAAASMQEYGEAIPALRQALEIRPQLHALRVNLGKALFAIGHVSQATREFVRARDEGDEAARAKALSNLAVVAPGDPELDNATVLSMRRDWASAEAIGITPIAPRHRPGQRLRLAYYGSFFDRPNWMKMYMGVINAHDRERFELNLIVDGPPPCAEAGYRDHADDRIWDVNGVSNAALAQHIAAAGIDLLIDLNGYSHQMRLPLLLHRAAPVQMAWNGMYGSTGFPHLDALVGDASALPPDEERFCSEPIRRVSHTYLPFHFFYATPPVAPPPCLQAGHITFGSLNSAYKLTDPTLDAWCAALQAVPGSRLLMRNRGLDMASNRADVLQRFAARGVTPDRVDLQGGGSHHDFLATYDRIDLALDTFPYNGGTTTAEALWQGVPVLTTRGDRWAGRTSRSILAAAGLQAYVAPDVAGFVALAAALAADPQRLAERRATQREVLAGSPACDPAALCRELEAIYEQACAGAGRGVQGSEG